MPKLSNSVLAVHHVMVLIVVDFFFFNAMRWVIENLISDELNSCSRKCHKSP